MKKVLFSGNWERAIGESQEFWLPNSNPKTPVNLPDDFIITMPRSADARGGASTGFFPGGRAVYTKKFDAPEDWEGKSVLLDIDGAYMNAEVFLNGEALGIHPYGYTPWQICLDKAVIPGESNELEIITRCVQPNSRWYSGGGLYREVNLWVGSACHIRPWDIFVTTPEVNAALAIINVSAVLTNISAADANGSFSVTVERQTVSMPVLIPAKGTYKIDLTVKIPSPRLWSAEKPNLYNMKADLTTNFGDDTINIPVGIRKIEIDAQSGMRVNSKPVKLLGGCIHHDNTLLGAAAFPRAEERKIELLKAVGYNAVRFAHNPPSSAMLEACDRLGMYVIDETFDCWRHGKNDLDYHLYFEDWWQRDTAAMVLRDRNHPSVIFWSIGNEIQEQGGRSEGAALTKMLVDYVHSLDSTRPVISAIHSLISSKREKGKPARIPFKRPDSGGSVGEQASVKMRELMASPNTMDLLMERIDTNNKGDGFVDGEDVWAELSVASASVLDMVGYNYFHGRYALDREKYPNRVIIGTETHAATTYDYYTAMMNNPNVIGDFIWTAYDNLGEAGAGRVMRGVQDIMTGMLGPWPWLSCYQGDLDLDGNRRPQSYYRKIMWGMDKGVHLFSKDPRYTGQKAYGLGWQWNDVWQSWTWPKEYEGKDIDVEAYADCDEVEFILNGESLGKVPVEKLIARFTLPYCPGNIKALSWKNGAVIAEDTLLTAGVPVRIELSPDRAVIKADGTDLCFVKVRLVDEKGITIPANDVELSASVKGGVLAGFGSGNPCTDENYGMGKRRIWNGLALVCLRSPEEAGSILLTVSAEGLPEASIAVECR
jgi:beta-galactosidase